VNRDLHTHKRRPVTETYVCGKKGTLKEVHVKLWKSSTHVYKKTDVMCMTETHNTDDCT